MGEGNLVKTGCKNSYFVVQHDVSLNHPLFSLILPVSISDYPLKQVNGARNFTGIEKFILLINSKNVTNDESDQILGSNPFLRGRFAAPVELEVAVCPTISHVIFPRYGRTRNNEYRFVCS